MIQEIITNDGEVISSEDNGFYLKVLNEMPFDEIKDYFINKTLMQKIKDYHKQTDGKCGLSIIQLRTFLSYKEVEESMNMLTEKKQVIKREGVNTALYFLNTKNK